MEGAVMDVRLTERMNYLLTQGAVAELDVSVRTTNTLEECGILTVGELLNCCGKDPEKCGCKRLHLMGIPNFGNKTLAEIFAALAKEGFARKGR